MTNALIPGMWTTPPPKREAAILTLPELCSSQPRSTFRAHYLQTGGNV